MARRKLRILADSDHTLTLIFAGLLALAVLAGVVGEMSRHAPTP
jgi:hypothetical protein